MHVRRSLDRMRGADGRFAEVAPKSRASRRDVPLAPADIARLRRHRLACGRPPDGALVFADWDGSALNANGSIRHAWRRALKNAGIAEPLPRIHDARHSWASAMLAAGIGVPAVTRLGGWSDAALVHRRYGHALPDELAGAGQALERFRQARAAAIGPELVPAGRSFALKTPANRAHGLLFQGGGTGSNPVGGIPSRILRIGQFKAFSADEHSTPVTATGRLRPPQTARLPPDLSSALGGASHTMRRAQMGRSGPSL